MECLQRWRLLARDVTARRSAHEVPTWGVALCSQCAYRAKHRLRWPDDAFYKISVMGDTLWAWDASYLELLRKFISSTDRSLPKHWMHRKFVTHVPSKFLRAKHRKAVLHSIDRFCARHDIRLHGVKPRPEKVSDRQ
jgi:hypothetical protein